MEEFCNEGESDPEALLYPEEKIKKKKGDRSNWKCEMNKKLKKEARNKGCVLTCGHQIGHKRCEVRSIPLLELLNLNKKFEKLSNAIQERQMIQRFITISGNPVSRISDDETRKRKIRKYTIECHIQTEEKTFPVCKEALMGILSIGRSKLEGAVSSMLQPDEAMKEMRGGKKPVLTDLKEAIIENIKKYRVRERHYGRAGTKDRVYLPKELTIKKMCSYFLETHPQFKTGKPNEEERLYHYYYSVFKSCFNIGFGSIKTDICSTCERYANLLKAVKTEKDHTINVDNGPGSPVQKYTDKELRTERLLHKLRVQRFFKELNTWPENTIVINFDLMQNQALPKTEIGEAYYSRQLWFHTFGIVIHQPDKKLNHETIYFYK